MKKQSGKIRLPNRRYLTLALMLSLGSANIAWGQATTGLLLGSATEPGDTVTAQSTTGVSRKTTVDKSGHYSFGALPVGGTYTVTLERNGQVVDQKSDITLRVGGGTEVNLGGGGNAAAPEAAQNLAAVQVSANSLPPIDITSMDSRTVITSKDLAVLPLARTSEAIALLAPGVIQGGSYFVSPTGQGLVSFGGSSISENAYYINGFNSTDPLNGFGGMTLPYGAIDQQQMLTGGYGAMYGRSDGGVISTIGKSGTNEWHFGGQMLWEPAFAKGDLKDVYYVSGTPAGKLFQHLSGNRSSTKTYDAYLGGPLIKDKLFLFAAVEAEQTEAHTTGSVLSPFETHYKDTMPKYYAKVNWNINDNNILELTKASNKTSYQGAIYNFNYNTLQQGQFKGNDTHTKRGFDLWTAKFTSYITDNVTLTALYGKMAGTLYSQLADYDPTLPYIYNADNQNPAITGGNPITNAQNIVTIVDPAHRTSKSNLRIDLSWVLGNHTIEAGIDNQTQSDINENSYNSGPEEDDTGSGYNWKYGHGNPNTPIYGLNPTDNPFVDAPGKYPNGATGYYVSKQIHRITSNTTDVQRAQYIQDDWAVTDRWRVNIGLRNDQFINRNPVGIPYVRLTKPQWAPRLGFSWDVNGDSSFKVYGNAGRYYLALPASEDLRASGVILSTAQFYTYSGIDQFGNPTGLTKINSNPSTGVSPNLFFGQPPDPRTAAAKNLRSEYQDEFILGFDKTLNKQWVYGAKATLRKLRTAIDDYGDAAAIRAKMISMGIDPSNIGTIKGNYLINPNQTNIFQIARLDGLGYYEVPMSQADFGFPDLLRNYYSLELYLTHPFDGKWFGKIDYTEARSYGNTEGQVRTDISQALPSATQDWDFPQVMQYANGELSNSRRHQLKAYGALQINPEWVVSGNMQLISGMPRSCLGLYGPDQTDPIAYGSSYHWCNGKPSRPGDAGHNPWLFTINAGVEYRPEFADHRLGFSFDVINLLNAHTTLQTSPTHGPSYAVNPAYLRVQYQETPRYMRFGVRFDY